MSYSKRMTREVFVPGTNKNDLVHAELARRSLDGPDAEETKKLWYHVMGKVSNKISASEVVKSASLHGPYQELALSIYTKVYGNMRIVK